MEDRNLSITLPVAAWNVVMNALGQRPFAEVAELISAIKKQADEQLAQSTSVSKDAEA
jgi:hypothetical protein